MKTIDIPKRLIDFLDQNKAAYEVLEHPEAYTAQELAALEHVKGRDHAKVVMFKSGGTMMMAVVPTDRKVDFEKLGALTGGEAKAASEKEFKSVFPDCAVGAMPPFGNLYDVPVIVDSSLREDHNIVFEAGTHTHAIRMKYDQYERLVKPKSGEFTVRI